MSVLRVAHGFGGVLTRARLDTSLPDLEIHQGIMDTNFVVMFLTCLSFASVFLNGRIGKPVKTRELFLTYDVLQVPFSATHVTPRPRVAALVGHPRSCAFCTLVCDHVAISVHSFGFCSNSDPSTLARSSLVHGSCADQVLMNCMVGYKLFGLLMSQPGASLWSVTGFNVPNAVAVQEAVRMHYYTKWLDVGFTVRRPASGVRRSLVCPPCLVHVVSHRVACSTITTPKK